jgi:uncharacterized protein (DUF885 family)
MEMSMKPRSLACLALAVLCVSTLPKAPAQEESQGNRSPPPELLAIADPNAAFDREFGDAFFDALWALNTGAAIGVGYYKYSDQLLVPDLKARNAELAFIQNWQTRLRAFDVNALDAAHRADWRILDNEFTARRWELNELRAWQWDPSQYNVADPFSKLLTSEHAPLEDRLRIVYRRLQNVPAYYAAAKQNIQFPSREHTKLAIEQNEGALAVFEVELERRINQSKLSMSERGFLMKRAQTARAAINDYVTWLKDLDATLARGQTRSFRLGALLYERKFAYNIQSGDTAKALYQRALQEKQQLHTRMTLLADQLWPKYFPNAAPPAEPLVRVRRLIDKLSEQHVAAEDFVPEIERQIPQLAKWIEDRKLLTLDPDKPLKIRPTPAHQRGIAIASIDSPGPYDPAAPTYYNVLPITELSAERSESLLREYNRWMLPILNIHEAIPGHYTQLVYGNKSPSRIKSIFGNGAMIEGWAVYGERMMLESGFGDNTAEIWLIYSKWLLRSVCNTLLDYAVHVNNMSEADAKRLLTEEAFQSAEEANGKWRRVQLTSVQLTSYFAGYAAIYDFREQLKRALGDEFDLKTFHEQFLSYGNAPVALIKELMRPGSTVAGLESP